METVNHEYYVSPELAKLLKEAGFDWEVKSYRKGLNGIFETTSIPNNFNDGTLTDWISTPTLDVAQRWLREVKGYIVEVLWYKKEFDYQGMVIEDEHYKWFSSYPLTFQIEGKDVYDILHYKDGNHYSTYESALEAGIKKALEIMLEKEDK
jgi:hypothetical protein